MFVTLVFLLTATHLLTATPLTSGNGRIYGGTEVSIAKAPWQVSVQEDGQHICGGAIYSSNIVVTAAHCVSDSWRDYLTVRYGSNSILSGGTVVGVLAISVHKNYSRTDISNDIAVILLSYPIKFGAHVKAIPLATTAPEPGAKVVVSGWGFTDRNYFPTRLRSVQVEIVDKDSCCKMYHRQELNEQMLCAASPGKDACQGDSGGPLVHRNQLAGIVSFGYECADPIFPGVYSNVAVLHDWIVQAATALNAKSSSKYRDHD